MKEESAAEDVTRRLVTRLTSAPGIGVKPSRADHLKQYRWKKGQCGSEENLWKKGQCGRNMPRKADAKPARLSRAYLGGASISKQLKIQIERHGLGQAIARTLSKIAKDKDHALCVRAAEFIAERTEGKVVNQHEHKGVAIARLVVDTSGLTSEEVARIREMESPAVQEKNG